VQQRDSNANASGADRVTERNAGTVQVQAIHRFKAPALHNTQHLGGKGLVQFDQVDILSVEAKLACSVSLKSREPFSGLAHGSGLTQGAGARFSPLAHLSG
jgi:hypothetical protein